MRITFNLNGETRQIESDPRTLLLDVLREDLDLRGAKHGCGEGECGACTVLLDGKAVNACLTTVGQAHGGEILTIEAMAQDEIGRKVVDSFVESGAVQCGYCTPGFVLSARALLSQNAAPNTEEIRRALSGNLCRCTGYTKIVEAVSHAASSGAAANSHAPLRPRAASIAVDGDRGFARPAALEEALRLLSAPEGQWRVLAGGTDLFVQHEHRLKGLNLLDLGALDELRGISETQDAIHIGALATYTDVIQSPLMQKWAPVLVMAAQEVGGTQIQNMGTVGGNLVNASPAADGVPPLFVLEAKLVLCSLRGERTVPVSQFSTGPSRTVLEKDELLTKIILPKKQHDGQRAMFFEKVGPRKAQTIAKASAAMCGWLHEGKWRQVRIALGAVAPTVVLAERAADLLMSARFDEDLLVRAANLAANECSPIDDIRSTTGYRRKLVRGLVMRNLSLFLPSSERSWPAAINPHNSVPATE
jgi:carbon-monoxide dehydrogenase small subunit/xanthine dehydrogenase small subunit